MIHSLWSLAKKDLYAHKAKLIIGILTIAIATGMTLIFLVITSSLFHISEQSFSQGLQEREVRVIPKFSIGFFKVTKKEQRKIDDEAIAELSNISGVESVRTEEVLQVPSSIEVGLFNTRFETDSPVYGIDDNVFQQKQTQEVTEGVVPVLVAKELVDIYNLGIAQAIGQPLVNEEFLSSISFDLKLGYSSFFQNADTQNILTKKAQIVGVASGVPIVGVTTKQSVLDEVNRSLKGDDYVRKYTRVFLALSDNANYEAVKGVVDELGFEASSFEEQLSPIRSQLVYISSILFGIIALVFVMVIMNIFFLFYSEYHEKRFMFALIKTLGAKKKDIFVYFCYQAGYIALSGILAGLALGCICVLLGNIVLESQFAYLIESIGTPLRLQIWQLFIVTVVVAITVFLSILYPSVLASRLSPKKVLSEQ